MFEYFQKRLKIVIFFKKQNFTKLSNGILYCDISNSTIRFVGTSFRMTSREYACMNVFFGVCCPQIYIIIHAWIVSTGHWTCDFCGTWWHLNIVGSLISWEYACMRNYFWSMLPLDIHHSCMNSLYLTLDLWFQCYLVVQIT